MGRTAFLKRFSQLSLLLVVAQVCMVLPSSPLARAQSTGSGTGQVATSPVAGAQQGVERREIPGLRSQDSRTYITEDGTYEAEVYPGAIHYRGPDREWHPIDNTLVASSRPGYGFENKENDYKLLVPSRLGDAPVRVESGDQWVSFSLAGAQQSPAQTTGPKATFIGALPGVTLDYTATNEGVKEALTLSDPTAPSTFSFQLATSPGLRPQGNPSGGVDLINTAGQVAFSLASPYMYDASGAEATVSKEISLRLVRSPAGDLVRLVADPTWLSDPGRQWPVVIDPTVQLTPNPDCFINSGAQGWSFCGADTLKVGYDGQDKRRALMRFDMGSIPSQANVLSADLGLHLTSSTTTNSAPIGVHRVTNSWDGRVSWATRDGTTKWTNPGGDFTSFVWSATAITGKTLGYKHWYPTGLVQSWVDGVYPNHGLLLKQDSEATNNLLSFSSMSDADPSKRPFLKVLYSEKIGEQEDFTFESQRLNDRMELKVNVVNGNLLLKEQDLKIKGTGLDLDVSRYYNNLSTDMSDLGQGWVMGTGRDVRLQQLPGPDIAFYGPSGYRGKFTSNGDGTFESPPTVDADLEKRSDGTYKLEWFSKNKWNFSSSGRLTSQIDKNDNDINFAYNSDGTLASITDTQDRTIRFGYTNGRLTTMTDVAGARTFSYGYDSTGRLTSYTDPANVNKPTLFGYDSNSNLARVTDPRGNVTKISYDTKRRVTSVTRVTDKVNETGPTTTFVYTNGDTCSGSDKVVGKTTVTDARTNATKYCYNSDERVIKVIDAKGNSTKNDYTSHGNVSSFTDAGVSSPSTFSWSQNGNLTGVKLPTGGQASMKYGSAQNPHFPTSLKDFSTNKDSATPGTWDYDYSDKGNLLSAKNSPLDITFNYTYNPNGTLATIKDDKLNVTDFTYDLKGNLTRIDPPGSHGTTSFTYDAVSRIKTMTDGKGQVTTYTYDALDRVIETDYADATGARVSSITYRYDENGNLTARNDNTGNTNFTYDELNRMIKETPEAPSSETDYTYDPVGNLKTISDDTGTVTYDYDSVNLLTTLTDQQGKPTKFEYDQKYLRTKTIYPNGVTMATKWDGSKRMKEIRSFYTDPTTNLQTEYTKFGYDYTSPSGLDTNLRYSSSDKDGNRTTYSYDEISRLSRARTTNAAGIETRDYQYQYDGNSNMSSKRVTGSIVDDNTTNYTYNSANELTSGGGISYDYDANGNLTGSSQGLSLSYNEKNQTSSITPPGGATLAMEYADGTQDRRVVAGDQRMAYNVLGLSTQGPNNGLPHATWWTRDNEGTLVGQLTRDGDAKYYVFDALGSVVALTDKDGKVAARYNYEPYGKQIGGEPSVFNPWRYAAATTTRRLAC